MTVVSDVSGQPGAEPVFFAVGATRYRVDLTPAERDEFLAKLDPYIEVSRRDTRLRVQNRGPAQHKVREWGNDNGFHVAPRGRIPYEVIAAYEAAHPDQGEQPSAPA